VKYHVTVSFHRVSVDCCPEFQPSQLGVALVKSTKRRSTELSDWSAQAANPSVRCVNWLSPQTVDLTAKFKFRNDSTERGRYQDKIWRLQVETKKRKTIMPNSRVEVARCRINLAEFVSSDLIEQRVSELATYSLTPTDPRLVTAASVSLTVYTIGIKNPDEGFLRPNQQLNDSDVGGGGSDEPPVTSPCFSKAQALATNQSNTSQTLAELSSDKDALIQGTQGAQPLVGATAEDPVAVTGLQKSLVDAAAEDPVAVTGLQKSLVDAAAEDPVAVTGLQKSLVDAAAEDPVAVTGLQKSLVDAAAEDPVAVTGLQKSLVDAAAEDPVAVTGLQKSLVDAAVEDPVAVTGLQKSLVDAAAEDPVAVTGLQSCQTTNDDKQFNLSILSSTTSIPESGNQSELRLDSLKSNEALRDIARTRVNINDTLQLQSLLARSSRSHLPNQMPAVVSHQESRQQFPELTDSLISWTKEALKSYPLVCNSDWAVAGFRDGVVLCAIIHKHRPDLIDLRAVIGTGGNARRFAMVMEAANVLGIERQSAAESGATTAPLHYNVPPTCGF
ncbi:hypothetical protein BOX15_Mlig023645g1, partial [Macrostomum lignano]